MKKIETLILKITLAGIGVVPLLIATLMTIELINNPFNTLYGRVLYPLIGIMGITLVPFLNALFQGLKLLALFDREQLFSDAVVKCLRTIRRDAFIITGLYIVALPFFYGLAQLDDAPGMVIVGTFFVFAAFVVAIFAQILVKIMQEVIVLKQENELTV